MKILTAMMRLIRRITTVWVSIAHNAVVNTLAIITLKLVSATRTLSCCYSYPHSQWLKGKIRGAGAGTVVHVLVHGLLGSTCTLPPQLNFLIRPVTKMAAIFTIAAITCLKFFDIVG